MIQALNHRKSLNNNKEDGQDPAQIAAMRIIVPLQGVVQGRGGLVLGSFIPCALFYFLRLYLKRKNKPLSSSPPSSSQNNNGELSVTIPRTLSRSLLLPRNPSAPAQLSSRASAIISKSATDDSVSCAPVYASGLEEDDKLE